MGADFLVKLCFFFRFFLKTPHGLVLRPSCDRHANFSHLSISCFCHRLPPSYCQFSVFRFILTTNLAFPLTFSSFRFVSARLLHALSPIACILVIVPLFLLIGFLARATPLSDSITRISALINSLAIVFVHAC